MAVDVVARLLVLQHSQSPSPLGSDYTNSHRQHWGQVIPSALGSGYIKSQSALGSGYTKSPSALGSGYTKSPSPLGSGYIKSLSALGSGYTKSPSALGSGYTNSPSPLGSGYTKSPSALGSGYTKLPPPLGSGYTKSPRFHWGHVIPTVSVVMIYTNWVTVITESCYPNSYHRLRGHAMPTVTVTTWS